MRLVVVMEVVMVDVVADVVLVVVTAVECDGCGYEVPVTNKLVVVQLKVANC